MGAHIADTAVFFSQINARSTNKLHKLKAFSIVNPNFQDLKPWILNEMSAKLGRFLTRRMRSIWEKTRSTNINRPFRIVQGAKRLGESEGIPFRKNS